jgi:hypothetical protein
MVTVSDDDGPGANGRHVVELPRCFRSILTLDADFQAVDARGACVSTPADQNGAVVVQAVEGLRLHAADRAQSPPVVN